MRLPGDVAEIVVEPTGAGIGAVENRFDRGQPFLLACETADFRELQFEPEAVVQWKIQRIEIGAAAHRDRLVAIDAELHADTLVERLAEFEDSRAEVGRRRLRYRTVEGGCGTVQGQERTRSPGRAQVHLACCSSSVS